jgi:DNA repair protein RecN (Recombination protein N)
MLQSLDIRDFVIVDHLELELGSGFTVLTGETGAGKSILLDALALAMGERADISQIREGCTRAEISAYFSVSDHLLTSVSTLLETYDFPIEQEGRSVLLKRTIDQSGRTKAFVNGSAATLSQLKEIGEHLVNIHGQHQHQLLLKPGAQRDLLDSHANLSQQVNKVSATYRDWQVIEKQIQLAKTAGLNLVKEKEQLEWQLEELNVLAPILDEWDDLQLEHSRLSNAASLIEGSQELVQLLSESENSILDQLAKSQGLLDDLSEMDISLNEAKEGLDSAHIHLSEATHTINRYLQKLDLDPERLSELEERVQGYYRCSKKFHCSPDELPTKWAELKNQLFNLNAAQDIESLLKDSKSKESTYLKLAHDLSKARQQAALKFSSAITDSMQTLAMSGGKFEVELIALDKPGPHGLEQIDFLVAGHPGVKPRPISKVASGGELARISLAIAVIASKSSATPTLIFDEVDSGIGGAVAQTVGALLKQLGQSHQVLCVTHLPQVAAQGDHQWRVQKSLIDGKTISKIEVLGRSERVDEIARMLGGVEMTPTTLRHARELLDI